MATETDPRPLSPHLQVWRWHPTMAASIGHRATGMINAGWVSLLAIWIIAAAWRGGGDFTALFSGGLGWLSHIVVLGALISVSFHFMNGIRHLVYDAGFGFNPRLASALSVAFFIAAAILGVGGFILFVFGMGRA